MYANGGGVDKKKYNFTIFEYKDEEAVLDDDLTNGDDFYGTKERVLDLQNQRMQRGYCIYFTISNEDGWYYESENLDDLKESLENSDEDDFDNEYYAQGGMTKHGLEQGDKIVSYFENVVVVENEGKSFVVNLNTGKRWTDKQWFTTKNTSKLSKMANGGMFKVGDKVSSSMFTEGIIESKKKMGDDTMYFVSYTSSENPNKTNHTVLRDTEITKISKSIKMANGGEIGKELMGGQPNQSKPSGAKLLEVRKRGAEIVVTEDDGETKEVYVKNNGFSGYTLHYKGNQYEFAYSL
jgi:hypothetical protein